MMVKLRCIASHGYLENLWTVGKVYDCEPCPEDGIIKFEIPENVERNSSYIGWLDRGVVFLPGIPGVKFEVVNE